MAVAPFPHRYSVSLIDNSLGAERRDPIHIGAPPEFGGSNEVWSPEHLLVAATLACLKATFDAYARRKGLAIRAWTSTAAGMLEKGSRGPVFTGIQLDVAIVAEPGDEERIRSVFEAATRDCIVTRSLAVPVTHTIAVTAPLVRAVG